MLGQKSNGGAVGTHGRQPGKGRMQAFLLGHGDGAPGKGCRPEASLRAVWGGHTGLSSRTPAPLGFRVLP